MPPQQGLRLHHEEELSPVNHPREQDKCDTGRIVQAPRLDLAFDIEGQLLAQEEVLGRKAFARATDQRHELQQITDEKERCADHRCRES